MKQSRHSLCPEIRILFKVCSQFIFRFINQIKKPLGTDPQGTQTVSIIHLDPSFYPPLLCLCYCVLLLMTVV